MNENTFNQIVGKKSLGNAARDSDGDKVPNILDCQPYNKNKQGWVHDLKEKVVTKVGEFKQERVEEGKRREVESFLRKESAEKERYNQAKITGRYEAQQRATAERARIKARYAPSKSGSGFASGLTNFSNSMLGTTTGQRTNFGTSPTTTKRKAVVSYVKKGKHYVKRTTYKTIKTGTQGKTSNNSQQVQHDILGTNLRF